MADKVALKADATLLISFVRIIPPLIYAPYHRRYAIFETASFVH